MTRKLFFTLTVISFVSFVTAQENYYSILEKDIAKVYNAKSTYEVKTYPQKFTRSKPKNIILMIGDGMGVSQVFAALTANKGHLFIENMKHIGFSKTQSATGYVTDSAAGGTAIATGEKTYNKAIGVNADTIAVRSILELAEGKGMATGLVSTSSITHATPASFIAHQKNRLMYEKIAADFLKTDIDVFIGGGYRFFSQRKDGRNLIGELKLKGYTVEKDINNIVDIKSRKLAGLLGVQHLGRVSVRKNMLSVAAEVSINLLGKNKNGFFLMVEGSQIDWAGHKNDIEYLMEEILDFDKAIGKALEFAANNKQTLVIVTADHETGGFSIVDGDIGKGMVKGEFSTIGHTGVMVPIFTYGPGADNFIGIMENIDINREMSKLLK